MNHANPKTCKAEGDPSWGNPSILVFTEEAGCDSILESYCYENSADNIAMKIFQS